MTLEEYNEEKRKRVANMTLAQARDLIAKTLSHSDMEIEFDKAVWMLLNCVDEKINNVEKYEGIKVGDEVTDGEGWEGVVTWISPDDGYLVILQKDGTSLHWDKKDFKKTGRHFPQIKEVLKQLQEGQEN